MSYSLLFQGNSGYVNAPHCSLCMYVAYLVPSVFAVLGSYKIFLKVSVVFIYINLYIYFFGGRGVLLVVLVPICEQNCQSSSLRHNVGMKGCVRFLFPPYFLLQCCMSSLALSAVISTFLLYYAPTTTFFHVFTAVVRVNGSSFSKFFHYVHLCIDAQVTSVTTAYLLLWRIF